MISLMMRYHLPTRQDVSGSIGILHGGYAWSEKLAKTERGAFLHTDRIICGQMLISANEKWTSFRSVRLGRHSNFGCYQADGTAWRNSNRKLDTNYEVYDRCI